MSISTSETQVPSDTVLETPDVFRGLRGIWQKDTKSKVLCSLLGFVFLVGGLVELVHFIVGFRGVPYHIDYDVYRAGGRAVLDGHSLYDGVFEVVGINLPFTYPPISAIVFAPLALISFSAGSALFTVITMVALLASMVIVGKSVAAEGGHRISSSAAWTIALLAFPLAMAIFPVNSTLKFGQINIILMLLVVADLLLPKTPWPRGLLLGLAASLKLTPAVFGLFFLLNRQWRAAMMSVVSGIGFTALAWAILPHDSHTYWTETIFDPNRIGGLAYSANQSWRGMIARFNPAESMQSWLWLGLVALTIAVVVWVMLRQLSLGARTAAACSNSLIALLASPVSWAHHWVWVVPILIVLVMSWIYARSNFSLVLFVCFLVFTTLVPFHAIFPSENQVELTWSIGMKIIGSEFVLVGVSWLILTGLYPKRILTRKPEGSTVKV